MKEMVELKDLLVLDLLDICDKKVEKEKRLKKKTK